MPLNFPLHHAETKEFTTTIASGQPHYISLHQLTPEFTTTITRHKITVGERSNFKKIPTHTQDHGDGIATRGESVVHVPS